MGRTETVTLTNMCMVYDHDRVLVIDRCDPDWPDVTFPGGHVEKGESFVDTVIREVKEETGLTIFSPRLCGVKNWTDKDHGRYMVLFFKTDRFEGTLKSSDEGQVFWASLSQLKEMHLANGMDNMLQVFLNNHISEHYFYHENGQWLEELK